MISPPPPLDFLSKSKALVLRLGLAVAALVLAGCAAYGPPRSGETIHRRVLYASPAGQPLYMDLYVPRSPRPAPVVLWIFGGSWRIGNKGYHVNLRDLPSHGIAIAAIDYRLSGVATYPAQLQDCEAAAQWLRVNGRRYGLDPQRIGASGESAGGHLAALLGTVEGASRIRAVCALYPPTDLVSLGRKYASPTRLSNIDRLLGGPIESRLALAKEASPVNHVGSGSPPYLLIHGQDDELVPLEQSEKLHQHLRRAGVVSELIVVPGKGHWFLLDKNQVDVVARFFRQHFGMENSRAR